MFEMSALPYMKKLQANFVANSEETREKLSSFGIPPQQVTVSHNAAPDEFVQANTGLAQLKKIAVISNHPPTEMVEAAKLLGQNGVTVDFIGMRTTQVEITPQLIGGYDVIVTIGKTVQYALLSHKPVYCYDHFGGCGYLNHDNFEIAKHHNFSGRGFSKKNAGEIALELVSLFADSFEFAKNFNQSKDFLLSCFVEKLLANAVDTHITPDLIECIKLSVPAEEKLANLYQGHVGLEKTLVNLYQENIRLKNKLNTAGEQLRAIQGKLSQVASGLQKNEKD
ncbi:hypothetical protein [Neisseria animalis]|nr:hypothetical protein [Neisseria animalis]ROW33332.1 hypothetical protein CGZ60_01120 [Neisseria animalis]